MMKETRKRIKRTMSTMFDPGYETTGLLPGVLVSPPYYSRKIVQFH
ncbi:MAG: hypothetical protein JXR85_02010 [Deltaproteobacteria bacterium]|nr:hypothetical protein [Deltaproteobacteria bacterium]